ncbi:AMP-binding protein [Humidisolicoccus flavus]|uniref:AMP-binding protein n=1 Tax=Humidisolicoccus flavus TaxID=3111414 RepID=UPI0032463F28
MEPVVIETGGSSGIPKKVVLSRAAIDASTVMANEALGGPGQWVLALPENYVAGLNVVERNAVSGAELIRMEGTFTPEHFVEALDKMSHERRYTSLVPTQLARLVDAAWLDRSFIQPVRSFDRILLGGQAPPPGLVERATQLGWKITRTYGATETCGGCIWEGRVIGNTKIRLTDQIEIASDTLADGYLDNPSLTAERFVDGLDGVRWYRTGDAGSMIGGQLHVTGRLDDVIISGGINVSLGAVERIVQSFASDAVVVPGPDPEWGQVPVVVTTMRPDLGEIRAAVANSLGKAARPNHVLTVSTIPRMISGKPDRKRLTDLVRKRSSFKTQKRRSAPWIR